ncbi:MAG: hypothetical protein ABI600_20250 [Luteolibacter sp.]
MNIPSLRNCLLAGLLMIASRAGAETINWYNTPNRINLTSSEQNMDAGFQFQLGVFSAGFTPTVGNISQWAANWTSAQQSAYNPAIGSTSFNGNYTVTGNSAPFTVGAKGYIWGRSTSSTKDEWILFRKADWTWPVPNPMNSTPISWNAANADEVILGSMNSSGNPYLMKSAAIATYSQWTVAELANEAQNGANQDPDRDGISNLMEFVFGTAPKTSNAATATPLSLVDISGQKYLQITIPRRIDHPANLIVQVSIDLNQWNSGASYTVVVADTASALIVRDLTPFDSASPKRFMRLKALLP